MWCPGAVLGGLLVDDDVSAKSGHGGLNIIKCSDEMFLCGESGIQLGVVKEV
jgi:hypothetical protein